MTQSKALMPLRHSTPKYLEIAERVRSQIHDGDYQPGDKLPRVADLKSEWGVSLGTLDRVWKVLEADGLITRTQGSGIYVAHQTRRSLTGVVGVLGLNNYGESNPYWNHLLMGAQKAARQASLHLLLMDDEVPHWERVDGILAMGFGAMHSAKERPEPMHMISLLAAWEEENPAILSDDAAGIADIMDHLLGLGHRRIAYLHTPGESERLTAYRHALKEADIADDARWQRPLHPEGEFSFAPQSGFSVHAFGVMQQWLREDWRELGCTAILAHNDEVAVGVLKALRVAKIEVPDEVSVVGFDGTEVAAHANPALTTWQVPLKEIGARGLQWLQRLMQGEGDQQTNHYLALKGQLIIGDSTAPPASRF